MSSNYEKMRDEMSERFLSMDPEKTSEKFGLRKEGDHAYLTYIGEDFRISLKTGAAERNDGTGTYVTADFGDAMTIFDILTYSPSPVSPSGEYVNLGSLAALTGAFTSVAPSGFFTKQEAELTGQTDLIKKALDRPGWTLSGEADAACRIDVFRGLGACFRFWDRDEDFPAQIQFMWDKNVLSLMHYETVWFASSSITARIVRETRRLSGKDGLPH